MAGITIFKTKTALPEVYGRVFFKSNKIKVDGVTRVFEKFLERGFIGKDHRKVAPEEGDAFLDCLKIYLEDHGLSVFDLSKT